MTSECLTACSAVPVPVDGWQAGARTWGERPQGGGYQQQAE